VVAPIIIILPSTGGIRDRQKMLTDLPIAFLERQEITPHNNNVMIKKAYTIINARLTIPYSPQCSEYLVFLPLVQLSISAITIMSLAGVYPGAVEKSILQSPTIK